MLDGNEKATPRQDNHVELDDAIDYVETALSRAESLYDRIMNTTPESGAGCEKSQPSLRGVLEIGAQRLRTTTDEINGVLAKIEDVLF